MNLVGKIRNGAATRKKEPSFVDDFVLLMEFSENEGPIPLKVIPEGAEGRFPLNELSLKVLSVDYQGVHSQFAIHEDTCMAFTEESECAYIYAHHFTLYDISARGYVRRFATCFVSSEENKIFKHFSLFSSAFREVTKLYKNGNIAFFLESLEEEGIRLREAKTKIITLEKKGVSAISELRDLRSQFSDYHRRVNNAKNPYFFAAITNTVDPYIDAQYTRSLSVSLIDDILAEFARLKEIFELKGFALSKDFTPFKSSRGDMDVSSAKNSSDLHFNCFLRRICGNSFQDALRELQRIHRRFSRPLSVVNAEEESKTIFSTPDTRLFLGNTALINMFPKRKAEQSWRFEERISASGPAEHVAPRITFAKHCFDRKERKMGRGLVQILLDIGMEQFRNLIYTILMDVPVVFIGSRRSCISYIVAFSIFLCSHDGKVSKLFKGWINTPITLLHLAKFSLVGLDESVPISRVAQKYACLFNTNTLTCTSILQYGRGRILDEMMRVTSLVDKSSRYEDQRSYVSMASLPLSRPEGLNFLATIFLTLYSNVKEELLISQIHTVMFDVSLKALSAFRNNVKVNDVYASHMSFEDRHILTRMEEKMRMSQIRLVCSPSMAFFVSDDIFVRPSQDYEHYEPTFNLKC